VGDLIQREFKDRRETSLEAIAFFRAEEGLVDGDHSLLLAVGVKSIQEVNTGIPGYSCPIASLYKAASF